MVDMHFRQGWDSEIINVLENFKTTMDTGLSAFPLRVFSFLIAFSSACTDLPELLLVAPEMFGLRWLLANVSTLK